jgi:hypothetical protein
MRKKGAAHGFRRVGRVFAMLAAEGRDETPIHSLQERRGSDIGTATVGKFGQEK